MRAIRLSEDVKRSIYVFITVTLILWMLVYLSFAPTPKERFFQLYALGESRMPEKYYPNDNPNIPVGIPVKWFIGVQSFMGRAECVLVRVKLGNETLPCPDSLNCTPAPVPIILEFRRVLMDNETWESPLFWSITNITRQDDTIHITLTVNDVTVECPNVGAVHGYNFRLIFEIWTINEETGKFVFGWTSQGERRCAWIQLWFNATDTRY